jgi:hypothetical protein
MGLMFSTCMNTGTYGVAPQDAGVASASVNTGQQLGGSIGTSLLNTIAASATAAYLTTHSAFPGAQQALKAAALVHGYTTVFWWCAAIFLGGTVVVGSLMRRGPLQPLAPSPAARPVPATEVTASVQQD